MGPKSERLGVYVFDSASRQLAQQMLAQESGGASDEDGGHGAGEARWVANLTRGPRPGNGPLAAKRSLSPQRETKPWPLQARRLRRNVAGFAC